jgi:hypothetical protein
MYPAAEFFPRLGWKLRAREGIDVSEKFHRAPAYSIVAVVFASLLTACGGGGGGSAPTGGATPGAVPDAADLERAGFRRWRIVARVRPSGLIRRLVDHFIFRHLCGGGRQNFGERHGEPHRRTRADGRYRVCVFRDGD